jgi:hypothetical protein
MEQPAVVLLLLLAVKGFMMVAAKVIVLCGFVRSHCTALSGITISHLFLLLLLLLLLLSVKRLMPRASTNMDLVKKDGVHRDSRNNNGTSIFTLCVLCMLLDMSHLEILDVLGDMGLKIST